MAQLNNKMDYSEILSICIPTYNRPDFINEQLIKILPIIIKYNLQLYISDNSENNETEEVILYHDCKNIHYHKNPTNIADKNFLQAIILPQSKYRWLISDSTIFTETLVLKIFEICNSKEYNFIFLNSNRVQNIPSKEYRLPADVLSEIGWHLTHISSIIYNSNVLKDTSFLQRYLHTNFIHHALIFESWAFNDYCAYWLHEPFYNHMNLKKTNTWIDLTCEIWLKRWCNYMLSLPDTYGIVIKLNCIKLHDNKTNLFSYENILRNRLNGVIKQEHFKYQDYAKISLSQKRYLAFNLCFYLPNTLIKILFFIELKKNLLLQGYYFHKWKPKNQVKTPN